MLRVLTRFSSLGFYKLCFALFKRAEKLDWYFGFS